MPSTTLKTQEKTFLYQQVIELIRNMHKDGTLRVGEKLPSLRKLATSLEVSIPTIKQAYIELERQDFIYARPQSGYYLNTQTQTINTPTKPRLPAQPIEVSKQTLIEQVYRAINSTHDFPFGLANPVAALPANKAINRTMRRVMSLSGEKILNYGPMNGFEPLRRQLAMRYIKQGLQASPEDIVVTNGAQEALGIALKMIAKPGDIIAVESPCYFGILELIENLGMLALEVPLCPDKGPRLGDVEKVVSLHNVKAFVLSSNIANPLGTLFEDVHKRAIVEYLEERNIHLIEDDVYGDLAFNQTLNRPAQTYSKKGLVLTCSSFSKTVAPSYRVGWIYSPTYSQQLIGLKRAMSFSASLPNQWTLCEFLQSGEYDRYVKSLRQTLQTNRDRMTSLISQYFPLGTRISSPQGGSVIWLQLPNKVDTKHIFTQAFAQSISVSPGILYSPSDRYKDCIRLSYGLKWSNALEKALITLANICHQ